MPSFFSELPSVASIVSTSSEQAGQAWAAISPVLVLLAVPVALVILALVTWAIKELLFGSWAAMAGKPPRHLSNPTCDRWGVSYEDQGRIVNFMSAKEANRYARRNNIVFDD